MSLSLDSPEAQEFIAFLRLRNVSPGTVAQYQWVLKDLFRAYPTDLDALQNVTGMHLREYVAGLQAKGLKPKTVSDRVTILKRFFGYLCAEGHLTSDPALRLPTPKVGKRLPKALTLEETQALLLTIEGDPVLGRRDRILFELMYSGGLRAGEVVGLRVSDIDFENSCVRVIGKGDRERRIYLKPSTLQAVRQYTQAEHSEGYLFIGYRNQHLTVRNVEYQIQHYAQSAGIKRHVTPHSLRHSIAVHYLQAGAPINFVQNLLGHSDLTTTGKYLLLTDQVMKQIALETETAIDRVEAVEKLESPRVSEGRVVYSPDSFDLWDRYVAGVLGWLGRKVDIRDSVN